MSRAAAASATDGLVVGAVRHVAALIGQAQDWLFGGYRAARGLAVMRIGLGICILGSLASTWTDRHYVWGRGARWLAPLVLDDGYGAPFTFFGLGDSATVFTLKYLALAAAATLLVVGWRTRFVAPLVVIGWTSLIRLDPMAFDAGDRVIQIVGLYACFADTSRHCSLDARRRARRGSTGPIERRTPAWLPVLVSNAAVLAIAAQVFVIYLVSSMTKVRGELWQNGTAVYYPLHLERYEVWPWLSEQLTRADWSVTIVSYVAVFSQLFFPFMLLRKGTRTVAILLVTGMHVGIAVTMGLPWFSLAMVSADMVLVSDRTWQATSRYARRAVRRLRRPTPALTG